MGSVWLSLRADLRTRWQALAGLALLLGLIGGVVLTATAGAGRTETAYPRMLRWASAAQVDVIPVGDQPPAAYFAALARLPQVASLSVQALYQTVLPVRHGVPQTAVETVSSPDGAAGVSADRVKILQGHMFGPQAAGAAVVDQQLASREHLQPGGTLRLLAVPSNPKTGDPELRLAVPMTFRVTAIVVFDTQVVPGSSGSSEPMALLSPSFARAPSSVPFTFGTQAGVRLRPGASMTAFLAGAGALAKRYPATGRFITEASLSDGVAETQRAIRPYAIALAAFAALVGLIALAVIGQLLGRQLVLAATEFPVLRALGMTRARLTGLSLARVAVVTVTGAAIAVAVAIAASPLTPIGPARLAEPDPGVEVNVAVLGAGLACIALLPLLLAAPAAWRAAGRPPSPLGVAGPAARTQVSRFAAALGMTGSVTGTIGVRMAFETGRGRTAVPVRSALVGTTVAVAAVITALVFGTSLVTLVSTPARYGQNWDQELDLGFGGVPAWFGARVLSAERGITGYAAGNYGQVTIDGKIVAAIGVTAMRGQGYITLLAGRYPAAPGEIMLGAQTLRAIHGRLGQLVRVSIDPTSANVPVTVRAMRIVGVGVFPGFSRGGFAATDLGNGAAVTAPVLSEPDQETGCTARAVCYNFFLLRYRRGTDLNATAARLTAAVTAAGCPPGPDSCLVTADQRPGDIQDYSGVRDVPLVLGGVLALLAVGTLAHVLLTSVRRRRRDLAVLKTLGLDRLQVMTVVSWQASALAAAALLVGLPLGVLLGRWAWALFAASVGVAPQADVPVVTVLVAIPAVLLLAILVAGAPGWTAARIRPASILRSE